MIREIVNWLKTLQEAASGLDKLLNCLDVLDAYVDGEEADQTLCPCSSIDAPEPAEHLIRPE